MKTWFAAAAALFAAGDYAGILMPQYFSVLYCAGSGFCRDYGSGGEI